MGEGSALSMEEFMKPLFMYYCTAGNRWGGNPSEVAEWTSGDCYLWRQFDARGVDVGLGDLRHAVAYSVRHGRVISLDLDMLYADTWKRQINRVSRRFITSPLTNPWDSVELIDVADEPTVRQASDLATKVRAFLKTQGLSTPPIGATFSYQNLETADTRALDWVGLEAYLDIEYQNDPPDQLYNAVYAQLRMQASRLLWSTQKVVVILQAYARNGGWTNIDSLVNLQWQSYIAARNLFGDRILAFKLFSWGRPSGTKSLPDGMRKEHKAIWTHLQTVPLPAAPALPDPTLPSGAELFVTKERAGTYPVVVNGKFISEGSGVLKDLYYLLQENIWTGARDWQYLLAHCPGCTNGHPLRATTDEIQAFTQAGFSLDAEATAVISALSTQHHVYPDRVQCKKDRLADYLGRLNAHLAQAHTYRADFRGQPGEGIRWDSVKGACEYFTAHPELSPWK